MKQFYLQYVIFISNESIMGIRGLNSLIKKYAPESVQELPLKYFKGSTIAIDTSILLYKFRHHNSNENSHLYGFLKRALLYVQNGINPIFILDGKPPPEKYNTLHKRSQKKQKINDKIETLRKHMNSDNQCETLTKIIKLSKQIINVTKQHHNEVYDMLNYLGFHVLYSRGEAEKMCAELQQSGQATYAYSDDMDLFPLGCSNILRDHKAGTAISFIKLDNVLDAFRLTFSQFVDLCILCGCDYCPEIPRVNSIKAYELIRKFKSLENVLPHLEQECFRIPDNYNYMKARELFQCGGNEPEINHNFNNFMTMNQFQEQKLWHFLMKKGINKNYLHKFINQFKKYRNLMNIK